MATEEMGTLRVRLGQNTSDSSNKVYPIILGEIDPNLRINQEILAHTSVESGADDITVAHFKFATALESATLNTCENRELSNRSTTVVSCNNNSKEESIPNAVLHSDSLPGALLYSELSKNEGNEASLLVDKNPYVALKKILALPPFDPEAPQLHTQLDLKSIVSLYQLSLRDDNLIEVEIKRSKIDEVLKTKDVGLTPFMNYSNIHVQHHNDEFYTFCSCKRCMEYREVLIGIMVEQYEVADMVTTFVNLLLKVYGGMLKNETALNKLEELTKANKKIYWITCGLIINKKAEIMNLIYDKTLSDEMTFVLFSSILMMKNPLLLLQVLAFHIECVVKAYFEGFAEVVKPQKSKPAAESILNYILEGYDELCRIANHVSYYLFAFENDFLRSFALNWELLCERMYQQHVYLNLADTMLGCVITLREDDVLSHHEVVIWKYIKFHEKMIDVEKCWVDVWSKLNLYNISEVERNRRKSLLDVHKIFDTVIQDALAFSLYPTVNIDNISTFITMQNRHSAWQNMLAYTKSKWPHGFFDPPIHFTRDDKCKKCDNLLDHHTRGCKCVTCSIAGGPLPASQNCEMCFQCIGKSLAQIEANRSTCSISADNNFKAKSKNVKKRLELSIHELLQDAIQATPSENTEADEIYHISWAVFKYLHDRNPYPHDTIDEKYFCINCKIATCVLARNLLNNEISRPLSIFLIHHYQPIETTHCELRSTLKNIVFYNSKMTAPIIQEDKLDAHNFLVKIYWTFILSLFATYFIELDDKCTLNLNGLELIDKEIKVRCDNLVGNENDTQFLRFLDRIKGLLPKLQSHMNCALQSSDHVEEIDKEVDTFLQAYRTNMKLQVIPPIDKCLDLSIAPIVAKKTVKENPSKCCFDHADLADHCIGNHSNRKRMKKECNHGRMNETRDRLRKKLSRLVNERNTGQTVNEPIPKCEANITKPTLGESLMTSSAEFTNGISDEHNTGVTINANSESRSIENVNALPSPPLCETNVNNKILPVKVNENEFIKPKVLKSMSDIDVEELELDDFIANEHWVKEALNYIEGDGNSIDTKKQPASTNPKKAAKKAKQKMKKEEERRISELQDMRAQFHDIYFKEFFDKQELKTLKASKKRDKKRINELECNIKKLQRAKGKVENAILELIATVKQTNTEFKFSYLATKEEQLERINETNSKTTDKMKKQESTLHTTSQKPNTNLDVIVNDNLSDRYNNEYSYPITNARTILMPPPIPGSYCYAPTMKQQLSLDIVPSVGGNASCSPSFDPSKRIVTIRRVNLPNVPEPQVTVTAKGSSPDKDKLLYTFVNGQLVQASNPTISHSQNMQMSNNLPSNHITLSKTQLKKERKRLTKLDRNRNESEIQGNDILTKLSKKPLDIGNEQTQSHSQCTLGSQKRKHSGGCISMGTEKDAVTYSKLSESPADKTCADTSTQHSESRRSSIANSDTKSNKQKLKLKPEHSRGNQSVPKLTKQRRDKQEKEINQKKEITRSISLQPLPEQTKSDGSETILRNEKKKRSKQVDLGQFDNNPYKTLHLQDSDTSLSCDDEINLPEKIKPKASTNCHLQHLEHKDEKENLKLRNKKLNETLDLKQKQQPRSILTLKSQSDKNPSVKPSKSNRVIAGATEPQPTGSKQNDSISSHIIRNQQSQSISGSKNKNGPGRSCMPGTSDQKRSHAKTEFEGNRKSSQLQAEKETHNVTTKGNLKKAQKQGQRNRKLKNTSNNLNTDYSNTNECIPNAEYYNTNEDLSRKYFQQNHVNSLSQQMQNLHLNNYQNLPMSKPILNVSIMEQLNRGVEVENLSLPPGITLTKVDPDKSERLRQKSDSISKVSKPLKTQTTNPQSFPFISNYYNNPPYANVAAGGAYEQSGIIMVEANPAVNANAIEKSTKASKNKKRRKGTKQEALSNTPKTVTPGASDSTNPAKMITLRNPMFHGSTGVAPATVLQQPALIQGQHNGGIPLPPHLSADQPAAIIKNDNGMFTIRNPALHQAVTNGLVLGGYRPYGAANYYAPPQEMTSDESKSAAEKLENVRGNICNNNSTSFSYFSNAGIPVPQPTTAAARPISTLNTISISCTNVENGTNESTGEAIPKQRYISAIGSEIKNAHHQKQKPIESIWTNFSQDLGDALPINSKDGSICNSYLGGQENNGLTNSNLQEKYKQSNYYNGFEMFSGQYNSNKQTSNSGSLFNNTECHMQHNCDDDSPPPTVTGFDSYLKDIPSTGVIRYDNASFLKNLITGQNLNNEISILNVSDSNFNRNRTSPVTHHVEITPIFPQSHLTNQYNKNPLPVARSPVQQSFHLESTSNYKENITEFGNDLFTGNNHYHATNCNPDYFNGYESLSESNEVSLGTSVGKRSSKSGSPFVEESRLDTVIQNMNCETVPVQPKDMYVDNNSTDREDSRNSGGMGCTSTGASWW